MRLILITLVLLGLFTPCRVCAVVDGLSLRIELDSANLILGEPLSGEIVLENISDDMLCVENMGERLTKYVVFEFRGPSGSFGAIPSSIYGDGGYVIYSRYQRRTHLESGAELREPFFLLTHRKFSFSVGDHDSTFFVLNEPGAYTVSASLSARIAYTETFQVAASEEVTFQVSGPGVGYAGYEHEVLQCYLPIKKPFSLCLPSWASAIRSDVDNGDYRNAFESIVAYQYGERIERQLLLNESDPHRSFDQVVEQVRGGLVGQNDLAIRKWRVALLSILNSPIGTNEWPSGDFDVATFIKTMPGRGAVCDTIVKR